MTTDIVNLAEKVPDLRILNAKKGKERYNVNPVSEVASNVGEKQK